MQAVNRYPYTGLLERVRYESADGQVSDRLEDVLPDRPVVSLPNLSLLLANPSVELAFIPRSLWEDVRLCRTIERWPEVADSDPAELEERFHEAVGRSLGDDSTAVAVAVSGGLDSLAVLYHAGIHCRASGRRLVALVGDLEDDRGHGCAAIVSDLAGALGIDCELRAFPEARASGAGIPAPVWSPTGPSFEAMPDVCRRITEEAVAAGAGRVLSGRGADEQLMCTRFTALALRRGGRRTALRRYLADMSHYDGARGLAGELTGLVSPALSRRWSFGLLYGIMWANAHEPDRWGLLAPPYAEHAAAAHREWVAEQRAMVEAHGFDWVSVAARCAIYPRDNMPPAGAVPWVSPFLDPGFVRYVNRLEVAGRYDPALPHAYHRVKAYVLRLFPRELHAALPSEKQTFARACDRYLAAAAPGAPARCLELGLLGDGWREAVARDDRLAIVVAMVESWIRGCDERGLEFREAAGERQLTPNAA